MAGRRVVPCWVLAGLLALLACSPTAAVSPPTVDRILTSAEKFGYTVHDLGELDALDDVLGDRDVLADGSLVAGGVARDTGSLLLIFGDGRQVRRIEQSFARGSAEQAQIQLTALVLAAFAHDDGTLDAYADAAVEFALDGLHTVAADGGTVSDTFRDVDVTVARGDGFLELSLQW